MRELSQRRKDQMQILPERAKEAASNLAAAFQWDKSTEGRDYWKEVYDRLHAIAEGKQYRKATTRKAKR